jgi:hypothetical protein
LIQDEDVEGIEFLKPQQKKLKIDHQLMNELSNHSQIPHDFIQSAFITSNIVQVFFLFLVLFRMKKILLRKKSRS